MTLENIDNQFKTVQLILSLESDEEYNEEELYELFQFYVVQEVEHFIHSTAQGAIETLTFRNRLQSFNQTNHSPSTIAKNQLKTSSLKTNLQPLLSKTRLQSSSMGRLIKKI